MIPFQIRLEPGRPVQQQVIHAVRRAVLAGDLRAGDDFPSVRALSRDLQINPNTAHKVIAVLVAEGTLEVRPGVGTTVTGATGGNDRERSDLLGRQLERVVVEARRLGLRRKALEEAIDRHWRKLSAPAGRGRASEEDPS